MHLSSRDHGRPGAGSAIAIACTEHSAPRAAECCSARRAIAGPRAISVAASKQRRSVSSSHSRRSRTHHRSRSPSVGMTARPAPPRRRSRTSSVSRHGDSRTSQRRFGAFWVQLPGLPMQWLGPGRTAVRSRGRTWHQRWTPRRASQRPESSGPPQPASTAAIAERAWTVAVVVLSPIVLSASQGRDGPYSCSAP